MTVVMGYKNNLKNGALRIGYEDRSEPGNIVNQDGGRHPRKWPSISVGSTSLAVLRNRLQHAAFNAQCRAICRRREWTGNVRHEVRDLTIFDQPLQQ
jgi:hypothetical protein